MAGFAFGAAVGRRPLRSFFCRFSGEWSSFSPVGCDEPPVRVICGIGFAYCMVKECDRRCPVVRMAVLCIAVSSPANVSPSKDCIVVLITQSLWLWLVFLSLSQDAVCNRSSLMGRRDVLRP